MEFNEIRITDSESFWAFLDKYAREDTIDFSKLDIKFEGWPILLINVKGDKFHSSLTSSMISGMALMNDAFQRAYAMAKYGTPKLNLLTNEDKQALDVIFKIEEGSTESCTDWSCTANTALTFLQQTMENMSGMEKMTVLLALIGALTIGGCYYLNRKSADKKSEQEARSDDIATVVAGMRDTFAIAADIKSKGETPNSREIEGYGDVAKSAVLKSVANDAESAVVGGASYSRAQLLDFKNRQSISRQSSECFDNFYILGLQRSGTSTDFNLLVQRQSNQETFNMKVSEEMTRPGELEKMAEAMLAKNALRISYLEVRENGSVARGQFNLILESTPPAASAS